MSELLDELLEDELDVDEVLLEADDLEELPLLTEEALELVDERLDELEVLLDDETLIDTALDETLDTDDTLLDVELPTLLTMLLVALLRLEEEELMLLDETLDDCEEVVEELLVLPVALDELVEAVPFVHAAVIAEASKTHIIPHMRRSRMFNASITLTALHPVEIGRDIGRFEAKINRRSGPTSSDSVDLTVSSSRNPSTGSG